MPEALEFAFAALSPGGPADGAVLEIESVPALRWCDLCQAEFEVREALPECPRCGAWSHRLQSGLELELLPWRSHNMCQECGCGLGAGTASVKRMVRMGQATIIPMSIPRPRS